MRKLIYKIRKGTKGAILAMSLLGMIAYGAIHSAVSRTTMFSVVGLVATYKKKGLWDSLDPATKTFAETFDEANAAETAAMDKKLLDLIEKNGAGLTADEKKEFGNMIEAYKSMGQKLKKLEDAGLKMAEGGTKFFNTKGEEVDHKALISQLKGKEIKSLDLTLKTVTAVPADIVDHTIGLRVPGIGQLPVRKPFIMDIFPVVPCNTEFIKYMDQETVVRDAKNVAGITPISTNTAITWKEREIKIGKVKDFIYISIDMLEDYDFVMGELQRLINTSVTLKVDNGLLTDDGTSPNLHSIDEVASEFDPANTLGDTIPAWAGTIKNPDIFALTICMASQVVALGKDGSYMPNIVLWNTIDKYKSMLIKDDEGRYLMPPFVAVINNKEYTIDGMEVRSNPNVPANTCYVLDSTKGTVYMRRGIGLELSYENKDNFETETVTMKGYMRLNLLIRSVDQNAFMVCSDIEAALTALAIPTV